MTADEVVGDPSACLGVDGGAPDIQIIIEIKLWGGGTRQNGVEAVSGQDAWCRVPRPTIS